MQKSNGTAVTYSASVVLPVTRTWQQVQVFVESAQQPSELNQTCRHTQHGAAALHCSLTRTGGPLQG